MTDRRTFLRACGLGLAAPSLVGRLATGQSKEVLPKHVTPRPCGRSSAGSTSSPRSSPTRGRGSAGGGQAYPVAMTGLAGTALLAHGNSPTRGKYSKNVQATVEYLVRCSTPTGLITGPGQDNGIPMHGHGFALLFLASVYGMITKESLRREVGNAIRKAVALTSQGQSEAGGWTYVPGTGDEGSVTVTQVQALRAAQNAGFLVPKSVIDEAGSYLEKCRTPEGGIRYSLSSGGGPKLPISAAAVATLYNSGQFDSPIAVDCLKYVWGQFQSTDAFAKGGGPRLLHPPLRLAGVLHGRRRVLGRLLPQDPRPADRHARGRRVVERRLHRARLRDLDRRDHPPVAVQVPAGLPAMRIGDCRSQDFRFQMSDFRPFLGSDRLKSEILQSAIPALPTTRPEDPPLSTTVAEETELDELRESYRLIREQIARQIVGQDEVVDQFLIAVFARGALHPRGGPGAGQDPDGQLAGPVALAELQPDPVHAGPDALGHHGDRGFA